MKIVFNCLAQDKGGLAMAMERNVLSLITISLFDEPDEKDIILGSSKSRKIGISKEKN
ncbi:MAG: hypothetical protein ABOK23_05790 [Candidatus Methanoperedens sp.]|nr:hypothetical protein [Candidatus Methanoperedens sp.]MCZ7396512.1 hypothetical protein [Candidatus Methanoperedens sp.]